MHIILAKLSHRWLGTKRVEGNHVKREKIVFGPILTAPYHVPHHHPSRRREVEQVAHPYALIHQALTLYNQYLVHRSETLKTHFLKCADSLANRLVITQNFGVWPYYCLILRARMYGCKIPWVSALAQGQGISVLVRAYTLADDNKYIVAARYALRAFGIPMRDGGVLFVDNDDDDWWYEEYACGCSLPSGVLNGFILGLLGVHDFHILTGDKFSKKLFDKGILTLCHHLDDFDTNYPYKLTYYDRLKHMVTIEYHSLHIELMEILYKTTQKEIFRKYWERWERYRQEWITHQAYRWLSRFHYLKSGFPYRLSIGYDLKDSIRLFGFWKGWIRYFGLLRALGVRKKC